MSASSFPLDNWWAALGSRRHARPLHTSARRLARSETRPSDAFSAARDNHLPRSACRLVPSDPDGGGMAYVDVTVSRPRHDLVTATFARRGTGSGMEGTA